MKVAILTYLYHPHLWGGAPRSAYLLAQGLRDSGAEVVVITTHGGPDRVAVEDGVRIHRLSPRNLYWVAEKDTKGVLMKSAWQAWDLWNPLLFRATARILSAERPDVVHVHKMRGLSPSVWAAARSAGAVHIVQTCRDYELMSPEGTMTSRIGRMAARDSLPTRPYRLLRASLSRVVTGTTAPSRYTLDTLTGAGFFPHAHRAVVPNTHGISRNGLAERERRPAARDPQEGPFRFLFLGRIERIKGVHDLLDAFTDLPGGHQGAVLDVAGDGGELAELRVRSAGHPHVAFHGPVKGEGKDDLFRQAQVVVVPSLCPEVFGNVIAEAFAFGKPVIGTSAGAIPELIQHEVTGLIVPPGRPEALGAAMARFVGNPSLAPSMREACLRSAQRYSLEAVVDGYTRFYERVLDGSEVRPAPGAAS